jgi:rhodanese-related sulfurtransferase
MTTIRQREAAAFFRARLDFQTDVSDVHAALAADQPAVRRAEPHAGEGSEPHAGGGSEPHEGGGSEPPAGGSVGGGVAPGPPRQPALIVIDSRSGAAWDQGHIPGAIHLPTADIPTRAAALLDPGVPVVAYCWGPGCNGATRAALALSEAGFDAREMLGGIEYWIREGFPVRTEKGEEIAEPDPLTAPRLIRAVAEAACGC